MLKGIYMYVKMYVSTKYITLFITNLKRTCFVRLELIEFPQRKSGSTY